MRSSNGSRSNRPLRPVDLNHVGLFYTSEKDAIRFYRDGLGFLLTDIIPNVSVVFMRLGSEHHSNSLFPERLRTEHDDVFMQHSAWEIGTYHELTRSIDLLSRMGISPELLVRRSPGSNYAVYFFDPEFNRIELEFGLESLGWLGRPKPFEFWTRTGIKGNLPEVVDSMETEAVELRKEFDTNCANMTWTAESAVGSETAPGSGTYYASGEKHARPFKIWKLNYYSLTCRDLPLMEGFYRKVMGLEVLHRSKSTVVLSTGGSNHPDLILESSQTKTRGRLNRVCFEMRAYAELLSCSSYLKEVGVKTIFEGKTEILPRNDEYYIDVLDPNGNPLRLSYTPWLHAHSPIRGGRRSSFRGLPRSIEGG